MHLIPNDDMIKPDLIQIYIYIIFHISQTKSIVIIIVEDSGVTGTVT